MRLKAWHHLTAALTGAVIGVGSWAALASFTASPVPWDGSFEAQPANADPVTQGAAHIRQVKGETSRRAGVSLDWGAFGNVTTDLGRILKGTPRVFVQSAAPTVDGTTAATCLPEADTAGNRHCAGGELWVDTDDNQLYVALDAGADGDADSWQSLSALGKRTIWIPASAMEPAASSAGSFPSAPGLIQPGGVGSAGYSPLDFDPAVTEAAQFSFYLPKSASATAPTAQIAWTAASTSTSSVLWALGCNAYADNIIIDDAVSISTVLDPHSGTSSKLNVAADFTVPVGSLASNRWIQCEIARRGADGTDTLAVDARLIGVTLLYTTDKPNDN